jgi:hypothetical protein
MVLSDRAVDQFGQVIDVLASQRRDLAAARRFFTRALQPTPRPVEVTTDRAPAYVGVLEELLPAARHVTDRYENNRIEAGAPPRRPVRGASTNDVYARGLRALLPLFDVEAHALPLVQRLVALALDRGEVHEHICPATVYRDEAVALVGVEPLD